MFTSVQVPVAFEKRGQKEEAGAVRSLQAERRAFAHLGRQVCGTGKMLCGEDQLTAWMKTKVPWEERGVHFSHPY